MKEPALKKSDACRSLDIVHKVVHELTLACNNENVDFVMPAWIAGIQVRKDASGNIRVDLPAAVRNVYGVYNRKGLDVHVVHSSGSVNPSGCPLTSRIWNVTMVGRFGADLRRDGL